MATTQTITLPRSSWTSGKGRDAYRVSHNGRDVVVMPVEWDAMTRRLFPKGSPNISLRHVVFDKLGLHMSAGGQMFVPIAYTKKTGRTTFRGLSFTQISKLQRKY